MAINPGLSYPISNAHPIIGPEFFSFGDLTPVTLIYQPLAVVQPQNTLPAPQGAEFEGPDPGLNANIIGKVLQPFFLYQ